MNKKLFMETYIASDEDLKWMIPVEADFKKVAEAYDDYMTNGPKADPDHSPKGLTKSVYGELFEAFRLFVVTAIFKWKEANEECKKECLDLGFSIAELKRILNVIKSHQGLFEDCFSKYCEPVLNKTYDPITTNSTSNSTTNTTQNNTQTATTQTSNTSQAGGTSNNVKIAAQPGATFCRIVAYDPKYTTPVRRHIYLTKKQNGSYKVSIGSAEVTSWFNEPLFDSITQAENFIKNIKNASTKTNPENFNFTITDKPIKDWKATLINDLSNCVLVTSDCGPAYIHRKNKYCVEELTEEVEIEEAIEKHEELNPALFNEDATLKTEVKDKINEIVDEFLKDFIEVEVELKVKDIILTGSNASYNYTKDSDLDIHIIADTSEIEDTLNLHKVIYNAYRSAFNKKFDIELNSIPVEVYVETQDTPLVSNGIYSVMTNTWVKEPTKDSIPEVDQEVIDKAFKPWEKRYKVLLTKIDDGLEDESEIDSFIDKLYELRQKGLAEEGEYSIGNLVFKEMRNNGYLDSLKELRHKVIAQRLSLHENLKNVKSLTDYLNILNKLN